MPRDKEMEGSEQQRRARADEARDRGQSPSEAGATLGSSKQRADAAENASHEERVERGREGKQQVGNKSDPKARPGSRD
jgi:hypothetical protein